MFLRRELYEVNFTLQDASHTPLQCLQQFCCCSDDMSEQRSPDVMNCIFRMLLAMLHTYTYVSPLQGR